MTNEYKSGEYCEGEGKIFAQPLFEESSTKKQRLGTIRRLDDGRVFAYALAGEALYAGLLTQGAVYDSYGTEIVVASTAAVGDQHVHLTYGAGTTATANYYADGFLGSMKVAVYPGPMYKVKDHAAATSSGTLTVNLYDKIREELTTSCYCSLIRNPQAGVLNAVATTPTSFLTGVPPIDVQSGYYFWNQVKGMCTIALAGTDIVGVPGAASGTSGSVMPYATIGTNCPVGVYALAGTDTWHVFFMLSIPGY